MSNYKCSKCDDYNSNTKGVIKQHTESQKCLGAEIITMIIKIPCEVCSKEFETKKLLSTHRTKCIERRAIVSSEYISSDKVLESVGHLTEAFKAFEKRLCLVEMENESLKKRLANVEEKKKSTNDEEIPEGEMCSHLETMMFVPISKKHIKRVLKDNVCDYRITQDVTVNGERALKRQGTVDNDDYIDVEGIRYYYSKTLAKKESLKWAGDLKIVFDKCCDNDAKFGCEQSGYFCDDHYQS